MRAVHFLRKTPPKKRRNKTHFRNKIGNIILNLNSQILYGTSGITCFISLHLYEFHSFRIHLLAYFWSKYFHPAKFERLNKHFHNNVAVKVYGTVEHCDAIRCVKMQQDEKRQNLNTTILMSNISIHSPAYHKQRSNVR